MKSKFSRMGVVLIAAITIFTNVMAGTGSSNFSGNDGNKRASKNFHKTYPAVSNEKWYQATDGGWLATFEEGQEKTVVAYAPNGVLNHTLRYYDESKMPSEVRTIARSAFFDYKINRVVEVVIPQPGLKEIFLVYMESATGLKLVTISNDEIVSEKNFVK